MKIGKIISILLLIMVVTFAIQKGYASYQMDQYGISQDTREWMKFYARLNDEERLAISYFPSDLAEAIANGYDYKYAPESMKEDNNKLFEDIDINRIQKVEIQYMEDTFKTKEISYEDGIRLVEAFTKISIDDIDHDLSGTGPVVDIPYAILLTMENEVKTIGYDILPVIYKDDEYVYVNMNHEFFDCAREIHEKYDLKGYTFRDYIFENPSNNGYGGFLMSDCIVSPDKTFNEVLERLAVEERIENDVTIQDILNQHDNIQLNDVVYYENIAIKVIEIIDDKVSAVIFHVE